MYIPKAKLKGILFMLGTLVSLNIALGQTIPNNAKSISQGQIEIVLSKGIDYNSIEYKCKMDTIFKIAHLTVLELEKNLLYKMTDKVHLVLFNELGDYQNYQKGHFTGNFEQNLNAHEISMVYFPVFFVGNLLDLKVQLRYGIAKQFIDEYLFGLTLKEKSDNAYAERIPDWLLYGFVNYFANGIHLNDFQKFELYNNQGKFNNINNIPNSEQHIFGTVLWYLFEKEKGKSINSAFWNLIKSANSFENSFGFQFGISFGEWLLERKLEIENFKSKRKINFDNEINKSLYHGGVVTSVQTENLDRRALLKIDFPLYQRILFKQLDKYQLIFQNNFVGIYPNLCFNSSSIYQNDEVQALIYFQNEQWFFKLKNKTLSLGKKGYFHELKCYNDSFYTIYEADGQSYLMNLSGNGFEKSKIGNSNERIVDFVFKSQGNLIYSCIWNTGNSAFQISKLIQVSNGVSKTIYFDKEMNFPVLLENLISENNVRLSFVRSCESKQSLIFLENNIVKALDTKGLFYHQTLSNGKSSILNCFYSNKRFYVNELFVGEEFILSDTFIPKSYSFDTINSIQRETNSKLLDSSYGYFLSNFKIFPNKKRTHYSIVENIIDPIELPYENWFYASKANFVLSNQEMNLPYSIDVPIKSQFNSFYTLFFNGKLASSNNIHKFDFTAFTNFNRRRLGMSFLHAYLVNSKLTYSTEFDYRLREFVTENHLSSNRNRTLLLVQKLTKNVGFFSLSLGGFYQFQQIIYLNSNPGLSEFQNKNQHFTGLEFCAKINSKKILHRNSIFNFQTSANYIPQISIYKNKIKNGSYLKLNGIAEFNAKYFKLRSVLNAKYALGESYILNFIGGSKGWINENQFNAGQIGLINKNDFLQIQNAGYIRGFNAGDRIGSNSICSQTEITICPVQFLPIGVIESKFFKKLTLVAFCDMGTAFIGNTPQESTNPFNTYVFTNPNYQITVTAARNPYLIGLGYGLNVEIFGYDMRFEYGYGYKENIWQKPILHVGFGKNF